MSSFTPSIPASTHPAEAERPARVAFGPTDLGLLFMAVVWGINFSVVKYGLRSIGPFAFSAMRMTIAAIVLAFVSLSIRNAPKPTRRDVGTLFALGLLGNGLYQLLFVTGMLHTRAGIAALVIAASPAWIAMVSRILGGERVSSRGWGGIALQLLGVGVVVFSTNVLDTPRDALLGTFLILCGSICWSVYSVLLQPITARVHPLHLSALTATSGALLLLTVASRELVSLNWSGIDRNAWGAVLYSSVGALVIAYLLFYRGIRLLGPTRTAMYGNLQPVIAILFAWVMLSEAPTIWQWLGTALIMCGLLVSRTARVQPTLGNANLQPVAREARTV